MCFTSEQSVWWLEHVTRIAARRRKDMGEILAVKDGGTGRKNRQGNRRTPALKMNGCGFLVDRSPLQQSHTMILQIERRQTTSTRVFSNSGFQNNKFTALK